MTANFLASELQLLVSESKRRYAEVRNAAERSLQDLRNLPNTSESQIAADLNRRSYFVDPFLEGCRSKNVKLLAPSIASLQRLINSRALARDRLHDVLQAFQESINTSIDVQLKILQSLPALLQFYGSSINGDLPAMILEICSSMQQLKIPAIGSTASATFQQATTFLFEKVESDDSHSKSFEVSDGEREIAVSSKSFDAYRVFEDICVLTEGDKATYLTKVSITRPFGLELIETLITNHTEIFETHPEFQSLLRNKVIPLITRLLSERPSYAVSVRIVRILCILLREFFADLKDHCEVPLVLLNHSLDSDVPQPWRRALCMETLRVIYSSGDLAIDIFTAFDQDEKKRNVIQDNLALFVRLAAEKPALIGIGQQSTFPATHTASKAMAQEQAVMEAGDVAGVISSADFGVAEMNVPGISSQWSNMKTPCLDQLDKAEAPSVPETYVYSLVLSCIGNLSDTLLRVVLPATMKNAKDRSGKTSNVENDSGSPIASTRSSRARGLSEPLNPQNLANPSLVSKLDTISTLVNSCWPAVLATSSTFLYAALDAEYYRTLIRSVQKFTQVAGLLRLSTPRDAFMTTLSKAAIPANILKGDLASPASVNGLLSPKKGLGSNNTGSESFLSQALESPNRSRRPSLDMSIQTLSQRNVMCLRALVNLAIALGPILEKAWPIALESIQKANVILSVSGNLATAREYRLGSQSSDTPADQGSNQSSLAAEIELFEAATSRMLHSTNDYTDESFKIFLEALCGLVSTQEKEQMQKVEGSSQKLSSRPTSSHRRPSGVFGITTSLGPSPQYIQAAIAKIGEVARVNLSRIATEVQDAGWNLLIHTLLEVSTSRQTDTTARYMAADVIGSIAVEAAVIAVEEDDSSVRNEILERSLSILDQQIKSLSLSDRGEHDIIVATDSDVQRSSLEALRAILDRCGETLITGWPVIFTIIASAFDSQSVEHVIHEQDEDTQDSTSTAMGAQIQPKLARSAFGSVQLICSDFLGSIPTSCTPALIDLVARFCSQKTDLNLSLTAIGLAWSISDHLRSKVTSFELPESMVSQTKDVAMDEKLQTFAEDGIITAMWLTLQRRLIPVISDPRTDIRNGAIRTLFRIIDACGEVMDSSVWSICISSVIFQIGEKNADFALDCVLSTGDTIAAESTSEIVLQDISGVFTSYMDTISNLPQFDAMWSRLSLLYRKFIDIGVPQFTTMTWHAFAQTTKSVGLGRRLSPTLVISTYEQWATSIPLFQTSASTDLAKVEKAILAYVTAAEPVFILLKPGVKDKQVQTMATTMLRCIETCPQPPYVNDVDSMTSLQSKFLDILKGLDGTTSASTSIVLDVAANVIKLPFVESKKDKEQSGLSFVALSKGGMNLAQCFIKTHAGSSEIYESEAVIKVLRSLHLGAESKYRWKQQGRVPTLWQTATMSSLEITRALAQSISQLSISTNTSHALLENILRTFQACGHADHMLLPANAELLADEVHDLSFAKEMVKLLVPLLSSDVADDDLRSNFCEAIFKNSFIHSQPKNEVSDIKSVFKAARLGRTLDPLMTPRLDIAYFNLDTLFELSSTQAKDFSNLTAKAAVPFLIVRCAQPLKTYISDQPLRGLMPTPQSQRLELLYILDKISTLTTAASSVPPPPLDSRKVIISSNEQQHLAWLTPLLYQALTYSSNDDEMAIAIRSVLQILV